MHRTRFFYALSSALLLLLGLLALSSGEPQATSATSLYTTITSQLPHRLLQAPSPLEQTAAALAGTYSPPRDLVSLTLRLRLGGNGSVPQTVNSTPPNYAVGTKQVFNVANVNNRSIFTVTATLRYVTAHAYWYVRDGMNANMANLRASADLFETKIYPKNRQVFGHEVSPGVDNDEHITVLITQVPGVGGYFSSADAFPSIVNPFSNQRDMIYMSTLPGGKIGNPDNFFESVLAHEFQHMIQWNVHRNRDIWLDEGASVIAQWLNGYDAGGLDYAFVTNPDTQLNAWDEAGSNPAHYGASYMFLRYLMERYGGEAFMANLLDHDLPGTDGLDAAIKDAGNAGGFEGAFQDWTIANVLKDKNLEGGRYNYSQGARVKPGRTLSRYPATRSESVHQYAADYISLTGNTGALTISFKGNPTVGVVAAKPHSGQYYWYANRQDSADARLTREFDLTKVSRATLQFWTWYDIEQYFDYAYAEASVDAGKSWTVLKGKYTTGENPNGNSYGQGWSGKSGVAARSSATPKWVQESVDLSPYAGKKVLVRFEYVTDEGLNRPGLLVDDVSIPEIGYSDDTESDNGWLAEGFLRIGSHVPQKWFVALIERGSTNRVRVIPVDALGNGTITLSGLGRGTQTRDAILVISPQAPKTTEQANYSVTVKKR
ncbi:MAG: immune inhibitor A [Chloroflexota bacterium]|nr:immune inhibitor A [Chloroflexota bacterium]